MSIRVRDRLLVAVALLGAAAPAAAGVRVSAGAGGRITVEAHGATVREILDALAAARPLHVRSSNALTRTVTGTYSGSLSRVLSRLLDGYDHVIHTTAAGIELEVLGAAPGVRATASVATAVTMVPNATRRISSNVDADDEAALAAVPRARPVNAPAPVIPAAAPAVMTSGPQGGAPRVSSNVDLDEETSR